MAGIHGADVAQLRALAAQFSQAADQLDRGRLQVGDGIRVSVWIGPFATSFRHRWDSEHSRQVAAAAQRLRGAAGQLKANADEQDRASAVDGSTPFPGGGHGPVAPGRNAPGSGGGSNPDGDLSARFRDTLRWIGDTTESESLLPGWTWGDVAGITPGVGTATDLLNGIDKVIQGKLPWKEGVDILAGVAKDFGVVGYGIGVNMSLWADVVEQGAKVDWSAKGLQDAWKGALSVDGWKEVGHDLATKLPAMLAGDFAWW